MAARPASKRPRPGLARPSCRSSPPAPLDLVFWSSLLHLILVYPTRSRILVGRPWLPATLYLIPILALLAGAVTLRLTTTSTLVWIGGWVSLQAWVVLGVLVTSLAGLVVALRRLPESLLKGIRWVVIALIAAAVLAILLVIAPLALTGSSLAPRGILALLALPIPIALAVAIARDRMFERDQLMRSRERLVTAREEERRRLRRRLHDGIGPTLAAMTIQLDVARDQITTDPVRAAGTLDHIKQQTQDVLADIRGIARELRPPALDEVGLVGALRQRADELSADPAAGILVSVAVGDDLPPLPAAVEVAAYRIATEAMLNAVRHGSASTLLGPPADPRVAARRDRGRRWRPANRPACRASGSPRCASGPRSWAAHWTSDPGTAAGPASWRPCHGRLEMTIRLVVVDDHPVFRDGLRALFAATDDLELVGEAADGATGLDVVTTTLPDVVVMDIQMPGLNGVEATRRLAALAPTSRVIVLAMFEDDASVFAAMRAGARGYLVKGADAGEITGAIRAVAAGEAVFGAALATRILGFFASPTRWPDCCHFPS